MSEHEDEHDGDDAGDGERSATGRKKRSDAGRPRSGGSGGTGKRSSRFDRRAKRAEETIRELVRIGKPDLDIDDLTFLEVVDRDRAAWGRFVAQLGEWLVPFGSFVDLFFGSPLVVVLNMAPSVRAARRDLAARREQRAAERQEQLEEQELRERIAAEHEQARTEGIFAEHPAGMPEGMTREEWLAAGGGGNGG